MEGAEAGSKKAWVGVGEEEEESRTRRRRREEAGEEEEGEARRLLLLIVWLLELESMLPVVCWEGEARECPSNTITGHSISAHTTHE